MIGGSHDQLGHIHDESWRSTVPVEVGFSLVDGHCLVDLLLEAIIFFGNNFDALY